MEKEMEKRMEKTETGKYLPPGEVVTG